MNSLTTLYVGNLTWECTDDDLFNLFVESQLNPHGAEVVFGRKGRSQGYGLVTFNDPADADRAIQQLNEFEFQGRRMVVREDRGATEKKPKQRKQKASEPVVVNELALFIGNLSWDTTQQQLEEVLMNFNPVSVELKEGRDGRSRGFALATFDSVQAAQTCMDQMNGTEMDGRQMNVRFDKGAGAGKKRREPRVFDDSNCTNCSVFVGNLSWDTTSETLQQLFGKWQFQNAEVVYGRKGERSRGYGTVMFNSPADASQAIQELDGTEVDGRTIQCKIDRMA